MTKTKINITTALSSPDYKVLSLSGDEGAMLERHKVNENALLLVQTGSVTYKEAAKSIILSKGQVHQIPIGVFHELSCNEEATVFLVVPINAKMKFEK